jgi:isopentenyl-diphosphate delta-isomerase
VVEHVLRAPEAGRGPDKAARRQVAHELGVTPHDLAQADTVSYRLTDPESGLVEHEYNYVFVGRVVDPPPPDPAYVADATIVSAAELRQLLGSAPFSMWFQTVAYTAMTAAPELLPAFADGA